MKFERPFEREINGNILTTINIDDMTDRYDAKYSIAQDPDLIGITIAGSVELKNGPKIPFEISLESRSFAVAREAADQKIQEIVDQFGKKEDLA